MRKSDWLDIGLKVLGVYFLVLGIHEMLRSLLVLAFADTRGLPAPPLGWAALLLPLVEIAAGLLLILISWKVTEPPGLTRKEQPPENLVDFPDDEPANKSDRPDEPFWQKKN
jgi:hypothetical protein